MSILQSMFLLAFFVAMLTITISRSRVFRPFRDWVDEITAKNGTSEPSWVYELVKCPYCLSFWVTGLSMLLFPSMWVVTIDTQVFLWQAFILYGATIWALACIIIGLIIQLLNGGGFKE